LSFTFTDYICPNSYTKILDTRYVSATKSDQLMLFREEIAGCENRTKHKYTLWTECRILIRVRVTLRLAVYRQSVRLGDKPLETHNQNFFFTSPAHSFSGPSPAGLMTLLSQIRDSPNPEGEVPVFISPRNRVVQLYPQALCSLFVASYDSQGYGGSIRSRLHTWENFSILKQVVYIVTTGLQKFIFRGSQIVTCGQIW
jgi:hypothetical protein